MSTDRRRAALAAALAPDVDAVLVTHLVNVRYLTGFTGSNGAVLIGRKGTAVLATDGRYETQAGDEAADVEIAVTRSVAADLVHRAHRDGVRRLAIERHVVTLELADRLREAGQDEVTLVDAGHVVERLRTVKDETELSRIAHACAITDAAFTAVLPQLRQGLTEREAAWALEAAMREGGAEAPAFATIVAFGPNSARPHHQPTDRALERGDFVKMDFGARYDGYHADMTRTVVLGPPEGWQQELHDLVRDIQERARARTLPGTVPVDLDATVRGWIEAAGHRPAHGLGHGVGLEIHESPFVVPGSTADTLVPDVPVTVEPGVYLPGRGGVRIEDTVVVRAAGAESLTTSPRDLIVL